MPYLWIALGSATGGVLRFWMSGAIATRMGQTFPWGTIMVNIVGSFIIGLLAALVSSDSRLDPKHHSFISEFLMIGVCGGYTTFSSFSMQTLTLVREGQWLYAGGNVVISVIACLVAVWLGYALSQWLQR